MIWYNLSIKNTVHAVSAANGSSVKDYASMFDSIPQKQCTNCNLWFPATREYFGYHAMGKDQLRAACKTCTNASNAQYKKTEEGKQAEKRYLNGAAGRQTRKGIDTRYANKNPQKRAAKRTVQNAIRRGNLLPVISHNCCDCGLQAQQYHHWSYLPEYWLDAIPLCTKCHKKRHMGVIP